MLDCSLIKLKSWAAKQGPLVLYGCGKDLAFLLQKKKAGRFLKIKFIVDRELSKHGKKFCGYPVYAPEKIADSDTVLITATRHESEILKTWEASGRKSRVFGLLETALVPDVKTVFKWPRNISPGIRELKKDLKNWGAFLKTCYRKTATKEKARLELEPLLDEGQIVEILEEHYFCRCFQCGKVKTHSKIQIHQQHFFILFDCLSCEERWIRIHYFRSYHRPFIYLPRCDKMLFRGGNFFPGLPAATLANEALHFLQQIMRRDFLNQLQVTSVLFPKEKKRTKKSFQMVTNRLGSLFHTFLDEWLPLARFRETTFAKSRPWELLTAEFVSGSTHFLPQVDVLRNFRTDGISYGESLQQMNRYLAWQKDFFFMPVIKKPETNPLYNFTASMKASWFRKLKPQIQKRRAAYALFSPVLFFHVRPGQHRVWFPQEEKIEAFIRLFQKKYTKGLLVFHGNKRSASSLHPFWESLEKRPGIVTCFDADFKEQFLWHAASDLSIISSGGGLTLPILSGRPFLELCHVNEVNDDHLSLRSKLHGWTVDENGLPRKKEYAVLIDETIGKGLDFYFKPEKVLETVSHLLSQPTKEMMYADRATAFA